MELNVTTTQFPKRKSFHKSLLEGTISYFKRNMGVLIGFAIICVINTIGSSNFLTVSNIINVLRQISINAVIAFGMTYVILIGGIDLGVGSVVAVSGVLAYQMMTVGVSPVISLICALMVGVLSGYINGFIITRGKLPPFIATLSMCTFLRGIAYVITGGQAVRAGNDSMSFIGNGYVGFIPVPVIIMLICLIITSLLLSKTKFGRHIYAIGGNKEAAIYSGINTRKVEVKVYMISGFLAAISGIILASKMYSGQPTVGQGYELDAIASSVLAGVSFSGGVGTIGATAIGALIIGVLNNGLNLMSVPSYYQYIVKGIVIVTAVYFDISRKNKTN